MSSNVLQNNTQVSHETSLSSVAKSLKAEISSLKDEVESKDDFLSLILSKLTDKEQTYTSSLTLPTIDESVELDDKLLLKEATFVQILELLEKLGSAKNFGKFPNFNDKLNTLLQNGATLEEFKNAKNLKDILNLSKKYGLGLEKISITTKDIKQLEKTFPKLAKEGFFHPKKAIISSEMLLKKSNMQQKTPQEKGTTSTLSKILKELEHNKQAQKSTNKSTITTKINDTMLDSTKQQSATITQESTLNIQSKTSKGELFTKNREVIAEQNSQEISKNDDFNTNNIKHTKHQANTKVTDVKHTLNTFAQDFKEQVEQYKPPLMRVQLALNPKNLGEMEVTIINRGSNLHVNFTSNTQAMNLFIQNQAEFKNSLVNMGFTNLEMNFSDERKNQEQKRGNSNSNSDQETEEFDELTKENTVLNMVIPSYV